MTRGQLIQGILDRKAQLRETRRWACEQAYRAFLTRHADVDAARRALARARMAMVRHTGSLEDAAAALAAYEAALAAACAEEGLDAGRFTPQPDCPRCGDTGFVGELEKQLCLCVQVEAALQAKEAAGIRPDYCFERFDLGLYPEGETLPNGGALRPYMAQMQQFFLQYAADFPRVPSILVLTGPTGLGKTFLLHCVANALVERGVFCVLTSPYRLNQAVLGADRGQDALLTFSQADLLLIDDIGSEPLLQKITAETLFSLVDTRLMAGRPLMLSTNLTPSELQGRYGDRFYSRVTDRDAARVLLFQGPDLRRRKERT
jgi:DNA replication protein DnaC